MTFLVLTNHTKETILRSILQPRNDPLMTNLWEDPITLTHARLLIDVALQPSLAGSITNAMLDTSWGTVPNNTDLVITPVQSE